MDKTPEEYVEQWENELAELKNWLDENGWSKLPKGVRMVIVRGEAETEARIKDLKKRNEFL